MRHTGSILIVDDDERNLEIICHLLEGLCLFETAGNGEEALEKVKHSPPDLVLLDIMMPGIDGYAACREIKLIAPHTKVILVSAKAMVEERVKGYEAGADDYIAKPFDHEEFLAKVRVFLKLKETEEQLVSMNQSLEEKVRVRTADLAKAEREARAAKAYLDNIIRSMSDPLLVLDKNLKVLTSNQATESLFGFSPDKLVGRPLGDMLVHDEDFQALDLVHVGSQLRLDSRSATFVSADGKKVPSLISMAPMRDVDGKESCIVCVVKDMRALRKAEEEKEMMHRQVLQAAKLASIGELATGVAHEINNPLTIIKGNLDFTKDLLAKSGVQALDQVLTQQEAAVERIVDIVNGLRVHARRDSGALTQLNLHALIDESVTMMKRIFGTKNVRIDKELHCLAPFVKGNAGRFQQIMVNLLTNARDALEGRDNPCITVETVSEKDSVVVRVIDNGAGIPKDVRDRIFEPFFTTKESGKGTGLGLSIVFGIVNEMGGKVTVDSELGHGTTFNLTFPSVAVRDAFDEVPKETLPASPVLPQRTDGAAPRYAGAVLVVDDEDEIGQIVSKYLEEVGFKVDRASNGKQALEMIQKKHYDLLVTDLQMPNMRGDTLVHEAALAGCLAKTRVIALTGNLAIASEGGALEEIPEEARKSIHALVAKPFSRKQLYEVLKTVL